jgi:hypothetical protein
MTTLLRFEAEVLIVAVTVALTGLLALVALWVDR